MADILFINANVAVEPYPVYPIGMAVASRALEEHGHHVVQYDLLQQERSLDKLITTLHNLSPDYVCMSLRNIDNVDYFTSHREWYLDGYRRLIHAIRSHLPVPIICGGPGFSVMPQTILQYIGADYGIRGEAEEELPRLICALENRNAPPSPAVIEAAPLPPSRQMRPRFIPQLVNYYIEQGGIIGLPVKRGCPYQCAYCTYPIIEGKKFRQRTYADIISDIRYLKYECGIQQIFFTDSVFNDPLGEYLHFARTLAEAQLDIQWGAFFSPRTLHPDALEILKESGLFAIELGTDAASDTTLAGMNKGFTWEQVCRFQEEADKLQLPVAHYVIFGGPDETPDTVKEGIDNLSHFRNAVVFAFTGVRILPGTKIHQRAVAENIIHAEHNLLHPVYYISPHTPVEWLNETLTNAFRGNRMRIFPPEKGREMTDVMKRFGYKGLLWD
ncbi:MAG: radical SAM protein, partial [Lentisphaerae bacterium]